MELSVTGSNVATWLELAVAPAWRRNECRILIHAIGAPHGECYAISMDGRWLCVGSGSLTIFHGLAAAEHFLKLLRIEAFELGDTVDAPVTGKGIGYCLCSDKARGLLPCDCAAGCRATAH